MYIYMYVCIYIYIYVNICIYVYTYIQHFSWCQRFSEFAFVCIAHFAAPPTNSDKPQSSHHCHCGDSATHP